jgi:hypothetical protein
MGLRAYKFRKISDSIFFKQNSANLYLLITKDATQYIQSGILFMSNLTSKYYPLSLI